MNGAVRIVDMPDLGAVSDTSSVVGEQAGSGRFSMPSVKTYMAATFASQAQLSDLQTSLNDVAQLTNEVFVNVRAYGAEGNGSNNDTVAFNEAIAAVVAQGGGTVAIPIGSYLLDPITVPPSVALAGVLPGPSEANGNPVVAPTCAVLLVNSTASPFLQLGLNSSLQDVLIHYPQQLPPSASAPNVYPAAVLMNAAGAVRRCTITNAYIGIQVRGGRTIIEDCKIGAFDVAITIDNAGDWTYVNNIIIEPFWDSMLGLSSPQPIDAWVLANGTGIQVERGDGVSLTGIRVFYRQTGIQLVDGTTGNSYGYMADLDLSQMGYSGVTAQSTNNSRNGWQITNMSVQSAPSGSYAAIAMVTGGVSPPTVTWIGGNAIGTWTNTGGYLVAAGSLAIDSVRGITGGGLLVAPGIPPSGGAGMTNPYPFRCSVYPTGFNQISLDTNQTGPTAPSFIDVYPGHTVGVTYSGTPSWTWFSL